MKYPEATFARAKAIADAVLWEGYVLYPYRASAAKNRVRFQWGVVGAAEQPSMTTTVLVEHGRTAHVDVRVRFLHLRRRPDGWDEAVERHVDVSVELVEGAAETHPIHVPADPAAGDGRQEPITGTLRADVRRHGSLSELRLDIENGDTDAPAAASAPRDEQLLTAMIGTHVLFAVPVDAFVSLLEPPEWAASVAAACAHHRCWPVLVGPAPRRDLVLGSPVILYDNPVVAPESPGDFFDGTEIDEMLTLRVQTLTDEEKVEARRTDPRAAAIIDRCEEMSVETQAGLHGRLASAGHGPHDRPAQELPADPLPEWSDPGPRRALAGATWVGPGDKVVLRPGRRADAHDLFLAGRVATVAEVVHTVDDDTHVAVTVDDDPAAELMDWHGRYLYFAPDELEPLARPPVPEGSGS